MKTFTKSKFLQLTEKRQHKHAAALLAKAYQNLELLSLYRDIELWLKLPAIEKNLEALSHRYHYHLQKGCVHLKEDRFLPSVRHLDCLTKEPFLPIDIYLDHLRSAHNVGSILRITEAFRLGRIHFSKATPDTENAKVERTSMGSSEMVETVKNSDLSRLRGPLFALETSQNATSLHSFSFPKTPFSLLLGNEEFGLSQEALKKADAIIEIPLCGSKNSLNVATAFSIVAFTIHMQLRLEKKGASSV